MPSIIIHSPGLLTTVQDFGRYGYQRFGMPVAGAMDTFSLHLANLLVGNDPGDACIEATLTGAEISITASGAIAITGANMNPTINNKKIPLNQTVRVNGGDTLRFSNLESGFRTYIAFAGGIDVPLVMGSRSTYMKAKIGGFEGRPLMKDDEIPLGKGNSKIQHKLIPPGIIPNYSSKQTIRILPGPEIKRFEAEGVRNILTSTFTISNQSDRMGYRLAGPPIKHNSSKADIISAGTSLGTIQVPGDGQPIILMADRQTTGGYTRFANVASIDLTILAQLKPGDQIKFEETSFEKAQELLIKRFKLIAQI